MPEASCSQRERARKNEVTILQAVSKADSQKVIAAAMDVSEATVNRLINDHLGHFAKLLSQIGLKCVPVDAKVVSPEAFAFMTRTHARVIDVAPELVWGSDE